MSSKTTFDEVLDAVEHLPVDQQVDLLDVVRRRLAEHGRQRVIQDVHEGEEQFRNDNPKSATVEDLLREIES